MMHSVRVNPTTYRHSCRHDCNECTHDNSPACRPLAQPRAPMWVGYHMATLPRHTVVAVRWQICTSNVVQASSTAECSQ
jgi:hypothetical protein